MDASWKRVEGVLQRLGSALEAFGYVYNSGRKVVDVTLRISADLKLSWPRLEITTFVYIIEA